MGQHDINSIDFRFQYWSIYAWGRWQLSVFMGFVISEIQTDLECCTECLAAVYLEIKLGQQSWRKTHLRCSCTWAAASKYSTRWKPGVSISKITVFPLLWFYWFSFLKSGAINVREWFSTCLLHDQMTQPYDCDLWWQEFSNKCKTWGKVHPQLPFIPIVVKYWPSKRSLLWTLISTSTWSKPPGTNRDITEVLDKT